MKRKIRFILTALLLVMILLAFWQRELLDYGIMQGRGQLNVLWNARPVQEVLHDPAAPDSLKEKLLLVQEVRDFAVGALGIRPTENYTTLFDQQGKDILWVVTACPPYSLESKQWDFPIVGQVSYKGFFDYERGLEEKAALAAKGYDTHIRSVGAWSTLGWFKDPILSNLLFKGDAELANTIIHELTHGTLFVPDSLDFNENLATFIGHHGALRFIALKWGAESDLMQQYRDRYQGRHLFSEHMLRGLRQLDELYSSFPEGMTVEKREAAKQAMIGQIIEQTDTLAVANAGGYKKRLESIAPNNAYFMSYERYRGEQDVLEKELENRFKGNLKAFLQHYKKVFGR